MKREPVFRGAATALVTPLTAEGIDFEAFGRLVDWQIDEGIDALVVCGTTGEGSTLSDEEHRAAIKFVVERSAGRVPVIAGTGSNDTAYAVELTKFACEAGVDGCLVVTPYYNKATQNGLVAHFHAIADASTKPIIVYNVPSRTGCGIQPATYVKLAQHPNITSIKEANGNISAIVETMALAGDLLDMYSGNDDQIVPMMSMGALGVISVLSNVLPKQTSELCHKMLDGDVAGAAKMQCDMLELVNSLFCEVNPIPVKAAMAAMGFCEDFLRLPLTPMEEGNRRRLLNAMRANGIDV